MTSQRYKEWVERNEDMIIDQFIDSELFEYPNHIFEGVLDDDYQDAEEHYLNMFDLNDVPEEFIEQLYNETGGEDL